VGLRTAELERSNEWTGVRMDYFVNFVPKVENSGDEKMYGNGDGGKIRFVLHSSRARKKLWGKSSPRVF
jgi:hypothetical protein